MSPGCEVALPISPPPLENWPKVSSSDEGDVVVALNPTFLAAPPIIPSGSLVPFDGLGEVAPAAGGDVLMKGTVLATSSSFRHFHNFGKGDSQNPFCLSRVSFCKAFEDWC